MTRPSRSRRTRRSAITIKLRVAQAGEAVIGALQRRHVVPEVGRMERVRRRLRRAVLRRRDMLRWRLDLAQERCGRVGDNCRFYSFNIFAEPYLVEFGDNVIVSGDVTFLTHDGSVYLFRDEVPDLVGHFGRIIVGNNCFIGMGAIIMPNVHIGNNCIIGAGAVVTKSLGDDLVAMGNPARAVMSIDMYKKLRMGDPRTISNEITKQYDFPADIGGAVLRELLKDLAEPPRVEMDRSQESRAVLGTPAGA